MKGYLESKGGADAIMTRDEQKNMGGKKVGNKEQKMRLSGQLS